MSKRNFCLLLVLLVIRTSAVFAQTFPLLVKNDSLAYLKDDRGNRILDYSFCGYKSSEQPIPDVNSVIFVSHKEGNSSARIQRAIDYVSSMVPDRNGFRGAVVLDKGLFILEKNLVIRESGVVLRGMGEKESILKRVGVDRAPLIRIEGVDDKIITDTLNISSSYIPVNERELPVLLNPGIRKGDRVLIMRPSTKEWISSIGCDVFGGGISALGWKPGDIDLYWDRIVTSSGSNSLTLDAPLTVALDDKYGKSKILRYQWNGRINNCGVENLTLISDYNDKNPKDEDHCWTGVSIENAENCWVRLVDFKHFAGSAVIVQHTGSKITVEDCISKDPVSEIGGMRRCTFLTMGQQALFQRCYSEHGIHDFSVGFCAPGPNAFVQCESQESLGFSGAIDSWACGLLFDIVNIDGNNLSFKNLGQNKNGAGWNTGNSLFWQCTAAEIECYAPGKDAMNRAYGCWAQFSGDGEWEESNNHVQPRSFFYAQLEDRLGKDCSQYSRILPMNTDATSSPTVEVAMQLAQEAYVPRLTLEKWINQRSFAPVTDISKLKNVDAINYKSDDTPSISGDVKIVNGRLQLNGCILVGNKLEVPWWSGKLRTSFLSKAKLHITRFVPGREGMGLTDRIDSVVSYMKKYNVLVLDHNYGLWYDRRRDDHERVRRRDGDVWGPFYEQPFARSGEGFAWDGLSKYDLNKPNEWYWMRLKEYADKAEREGMLLFHENYFQHNILEAGAHWVDCPWRTSNNINSTNFPEPVPFSGDKRIFMADLFYDISQPVRRELHRKYIRQCLESFANNKNVIQLISAEFTGPLHFVEFWVDVIAEWETETGKNALIALSTTKDVQDAILSDAKRSKIVDIIDIRYWHYKNDGTVYAPEGGKNMAPRQHMRKMKVGKVSFDEAYKAVNEYRIKYPEKAVTYYAQNYPDMAWASFMAGGSCPALPVNDKQFLADALKMKVVETGTNAYRKLVKSDIGEIIYYQSGVQVPLSVSAGKYILKYIEPNTGKMEVIQNNLKIGTDFNLKIPQGKPGVYWVQKK